MLGLSLKNQIFGRCFLPWQAASHGGTKGPSHVRALAAMFSTMAKKNPLIGHKAEPQQTGDWVPFTSHVTGGQTRCPFVTFKSMN